MHPDSWAFVDGELHRRSAAVVSIDHAGFLLGDGIFETLRLYAGRPFCLRDHLGRLRQSARTLALPVPFTDAAIQRAIETLVKCNGLAKEPGRLRLTLARATPERCTWVLTADRYEPPGPEAYARGVAVGWAGSPQPDTLWSEIKSTSRQWYAIQRRQAHLAGLFEVLHWNRSGQLTEGSFTNVFVVDAHGVLRTPAPADGCLPGISRQTVLDVARRLGIAYIEGGVTTGSTDSAREVFLTGSLVEVVPVQRLGVRTLESCPGETTRQLLAAYRKLAVRPEEA